MSIIKYINRIEGYQFSTEGLVIRKTHRINLICPENDSSFLIEPNIFSTKCLSESARPDKSSCLLEQEGPSSILVGATVSKGIGATVSKGNGATVSRGIGTTVFKGIGVTVFEGIGVTVFNGIGATAFKGIGATVSKGMGSAGISEFEMGVIPSCIK